MLIRRLVPSDAALYQTLRLMALLECPSAFSSSYEDECTLPITTIEDQLAHNSGRTIFGAFIDSELVGMVGVGRERAPKLRHKGFIRSMFVTAAHRRSGIGKQLLERAVAFAATMDGLRKITLAVTAGNSAAVALYESVGFKTFAHEQDALMVDGALFSEVLMVRNLENA